MGKPITSTAQFAEELTNYIYFNALSKREVKSVARSIQYPIGLLHPTKKSWLRGQLAFLYAFIGTLSLRWSLGECAAVSEPQIEDIASRYTRGLLTRCIPRSMLRDYETRTSTWSGFFGEPIEPDATMRLASSFYELLTRKKCPEIHQCVLALRFNRYIELFIGSIQQLIEDLQLPRP